MIQINKRNIGISIFLTIITCGIYGMYWMYLLVKNTRSIQKNAKKCVGEMLCLFFVPFYSVYWWYTRGEKVKHSFNDHGYTSVGSGGAYLLLLLFRLGIVAMAIMQSDFNGLKSERHMEDPRKASAICDKVEEVLWYAFFGVLTTVVNFAVYLVMTRLVLKGFFEEHEAAVTLASNWVAWSVAVLFAFFVNKSYVFENKEGGKSLLFQFGSFVLMRLASGVFENFVPTALIGWLHMHDVAAKALVAVAVIVANYFFSKFVAFRRRKNASGGLPEDAVMSHEDSGNTPSGNDTTVQDAESTEDGRA